MRFTGITKDNKHSYDDFGVTIQSRDIGYPEKIKVIATVPGSNVTYDFSCINGSQPYSERLLTYVFNIIAKSQQDFNYQCDLLTTWLINGGKSALFDDTVIKYHFEAECLKVSREIHENLRTGIVTAEFSAYPFKISNNLADDYLWDTFSFEHDVSPICDFDVTGNTEIEIVLRCDNFVVPEIYCSQSMIILKNGKAYSIAAGMTKRSDFTFKDGSNKMTVTRAGYIRFNIYEEVI